MIRFFGYSLLLFVSLIFEATITRAPLVLSVLIVFSVVEKKEWIFPIGIVTGLFLDSLTFRLLGVSSLFFVCMLGTLFLYEKKFEIHNMFFGIIFTFIATLVYGLVFQQIDIIGAIITTFLTGFLLFANTIFHKKKQ